MNADEVRPKQKSRSKAVASPQRLFFTAEALTGDFSPSSVLGDSMEDSPKDGAEIVRSNGSSEVFRLWEAMFDRLVRWRRFHRGNVDPV